MRGYIKGFAYQICRSVDAWLRLSESEALYLEGGEDFDILQTHRATAVQVKHRSRPITLRSWDVIKAINDFWDLKKKNPRIDVRFRFLTTSPVGIEMGNPFGIGKAGIDQWTECRRDRSKTVLKYLGQLKKEEKRDVDCFPVFFFDFRFGYARAEGLQFLFIYLEFRCPVAFLSTRTHPA